MSEDGLKIAYVDTVGLKLFSLQNGQSQNVAKILKPGDDMEIAPIWSNDSMNTAYPIQAIFQPRWSADGEYICFLFHQANYAPDGGKIVFIYSKYEDQKLYSLAMIDSDGSNLTSLKQGGLKNLMPFFAPDGKYIFYYRAGERDRIVMLDLKRKEIVYASPAFEFFTSFSALLPD